MTLIEALRELKETASDKPISAAKVIFDEHKSDFQKLLDSILDGFGGLSKYGDVNYNIDETSIEIKESKLWVTVELWTMVPANEEDFEWDSGTGWGHYDYYSGVNLVEDWIHDTGIDPENIAKQAGWRQEGDFYVSSETPWKLATVGDAEFDGESNLNKNMPHHLFDAKDLEITLFEYIYFALDLDEAEQKLGESFFDNYYGEKAWMINRILSHMNDEEAYYSGWLYIWPDGESYEECLEDFKDKEDYEDLERSFINHYSDSEAHEAGLYRPRYSDASDAEWEKIIEAAHEWDKKLGLDPIKVIQ